MRTHSTYKQDNKGLTALDYVIRSKAYDLISLLLKNGAKTEMNKIEMV